MRLIRRRRLALVAPLICLAIPLALPGGASSRVENAVLSNNILTLRGSSGNDTITIRTVATDIGDPTKDFLEIEDLGGIDVVPPGCFRRDANAIHCPRQSVGLIDAFMGAGNDVLRSESGVAIRVDGEFGNDILTGSDGAVGGDHLAGPGDDNLIGGPGNDTLVGQAGNDRLVGGSGKDGLKGGPGKDRLACGAGDDTAVGGGGKDTAKGCETAKTM